MLGSYPIGSQAVGGSGYASATVAVQVITAAGRASGISTVFASGVTIFTASGRSLGTSLALGHSNVVTQGISAADKIIFSLMPVPYAFSFVQSEPMYVIKPY